MNDDSNELMMPFVVVVSNGGQFDDNAFTAGFEAGLLMDEMKTCLAIRQSTQIVAFPGSRYVHTSVVPQLDLSAMRYGLTMTHEVHEDDETWTFVEFNPVAPIEIKLEETDE